MSEFRTIQIMTTAGLAMVEAFVDEPFAAREVGRRWIVTHLPGGVAFPFRFPSIVAAQGFMQSVRKLRNDWWGIVLAKDVPPAQRKAMHDIAAGLGGVWRSGGPPADEQLQQMRPLNGMEAAE